MGSAPEHLVRREGQVRFEYVASGTEILFRDHADPAPRSRRVFFSHRPETLRRWLDPPVTIRKRLQSVPPLLTERLRECQIDAVIKLETSLAADHPRALIQMATGAGKTYTAIGSWSMRSSGGVCFSPTGRIWAARQGTSVYIFDRPAPAA